MPPDFGAAEGRDEMFKLRVEGGFGSEQFGHLRCVVTHANLQPAVANYVRRPGDSTWRAMALDVLRIEEGLITEIVMFAPDTFPTLRASDIDGPGAGDEHASLIDSMLGEVVSFSATPAGADRRKGDRVNRWSPYFLTQKHWNLKEAGQSNEKCNLRNQHYPGWLLRPHQNDCR